MCSWACFLRVRSIMVMSERARKRARSRGRVIKDHERPRVNALECLFFARPRYFRPLSQGLKYLGRSRLCRERTTMQPNSSARWHCRKISKHKKVNKEIIQWEANKRVRLAGFIFWARPLASVEIVIDLLCSAMASRECVRVNDWGLGHGLDQ